jgi:hypothetical protein
VCRPSSALWPVVAGIDVGAGHYWKRLGRFIITSIRDLTGVGIDTEADDLKPRFPTSSSSQMITYKFSNGCVFAHTVPRAAVHCILRGTPTRIVTVFAYVCSRINFFTNPHISVVSAAINIVWCVSFPPPSLTHAHTPSHSLVCACI